MIPRFQHEIINIWDNGYFNVNVSLFDIVELKDGPYDGFAEHLKETFKICYTYMKVYSYTFSVAGKH